MSITAQCSYDKILSELILLVEMIVTIIEEVWEYTSASLLLSIVETFIFTSKHF